MISTRPSRLLAIAAGVVIAAASLVSALPASAHDNSVSSPAALMALTFTHNATPTVSSTGLKKHVTAATTDVSPDATGIKYQWYRTGTKISGATKADYTLTSSDYNQTIYVQVSYSKSGYSTYTQPSAPGTEFGQFWLRATPTLPVITGTATVGSTLSIAPRTYKDVSNGNADVASPALKYQWYSGSTAISSSKGGTAATYAVKSGDKGKTIKVKVTATGPSTILPSVATSVATPAVGTDSLPDWDAPAPELNILGSSSAFATSIQAAATGIGSPNATDNKLAYQWLRDGAAIKNAVSASYLLTTADRDHLIGVRITTSHVPSGSHTYTSVVTYSQEHDYTSNSSATPFISTQEGPGYAIGSTIGVSQPSSTDADGTSLPGGGTETTYQWKRDGAIIPAAQGGTDKYYLLRAADEGAVISVDQTQGRVGFIPFTQTTASSSVVPKGTIVGTGLATPTVTTDGSGDLVANTGSAGTGTTTSAGTPAATWEYQWLRDGVDIEGATAQTYELVAADNGFNVTVRATAVLPGYTPVPLTESAPVDYSITFQAGPGHSPRSTGGNWSLGEHVQVIEYGFVTTKDGNITFPGTAFQWLRAGVPISGATNSVYTLQPADVGKFVNARVTTTSPGYAPLVIETDGVVIIAGLTSDESVAAIEPGATPGTLHAFVENLYPATPVPSYKYQWYRGTSKISGATKSTYKLTSSDYRKLISVKITMTRAGFTAHPDPVTQAHYLPNPITFPTTTGIDYSIRGDVASDLTPHSSTPVKVGDALNASIPPFFEADGTTTLIQMPDLSYTWYRSGSAISGQHAATYIVQSADKGKKITVKVTASLPGRLSRTTPASNASATVTSGVFAGTFVPAITGDSATKKKTVTVTGTTITSPSGYTKSYVWKRSGSTVSGATSNTFTLKSTDSAKDVTVTITLKKSGYTTKTITVHANAITSGEAVAIIGNPDGAHTLSAAPPTYYYWNDLGSDQVSFDALSFQWKVNGVNVASDPGHPEQYTPVLADSGKTVTVVVTAPAPYHFTRIDNSADPVLIGL